MKSKRIERLQDHVVLMVDNDRTDIAVEMIAGFYNTHCAYCGNTLKNRDISLNDRRYFCSIDHKVGYIASLVTG